MTALRRLLAAVALAAEITGSGSVAEAQQAPDSTSELSGVVLTSDGHAVPNADVGLLGLGTARTDSLGQFAFRGVPGGTLIVRVQRLGLEPITRTVTLAAAGRREIVLRFGEAATTLTPVVVLDSALLLHQPGGFDHRRLTGQGLYLTESDITRRHAQRVEHLIASLPGLAVDTSGVVRIDRGRTSFYGNNCRDGAQLFIDGVAVNGSFTFRSMSPDALRGIEIYRGVASTPVELRSARMVCGTVAIWTK